MENRRWQDGVMIVLGVWLFFSPFILQYTSFGPAAFNSYILGVAVTVVAIVALAAPHLWEEWVNFVLAIWIVIAPWVLGFDTTSTVATVNHVVLGILIGIDALWAINQRSMQAPPISHG